MIKVRLTASMLLVIRKRNLAGEAALRMEMGELKTDR